MHPFWTWTKATASRFISVLTVVFILAGPYYANLLTPQARRLMIWCVRDTITLLLFTVLLALGCTVIGAAVRRLGRPWLVRITDHLFVAALGAGLLANLHFHTGNRPGYRIAQFGMETRTLWIALAGLIGFSLARQNSRLPWRCRQLCLIVSPAVLILALQMFRAPHFAPGLEPLPPLASGDAYSANTPARPIYLFLLDAWSYDRTYDSDGMPRPVYSNLADLAQQSIVFHRAYSPADNTDESIPRLLFQTDLPVVWEQGQCSFRREGQPLACASMPSIFSLARARGYRTFMVSFCLPTRAWLGQNVGTCRSYPWLSEYRPHSLPAQAGLHLFRVTRYWTDPWSELLNHRLRRWVDDRSALRLYRDMEADIDAIIGRQPSNTLAVFHYPLPHVPFLLDADGQYSARNDPWAWVWTNAEGYERNLACTDRFIGRLVQAMKRADRFDDALLIFTSDHAWSHDPKRLADAPDHDRRHVPLLLKLPGQDRPCSITQPFETRYLGSMIERILTNERTTIADVEGLVASISPR